MLTVAFGFVLTFSLTGLADIKEMSDMKGVPIYLHPADLVCYRAAEMQAKMFGIPLRQPPEPDVFVSATSNI